MDLDNFLLIRVIVVGTKGVGKSSISKLFTERKWQDEPHEEGIEYRPCYRFFNDQRDFVKFLIVDVPCAEVVRQYNSGYMHGIIGAVIVFDLANRDTI